MFEVFVRSNIERPTNVVVEQRATSVTIGQASPTVGALKRIIILQKKTYPVFRKRTVTTRDRRDGIKFSIAFINFPLLNGFSWKVLDFSLFLRFDNQNGYQTRLKRMRRKLQAKKNRRRWPKKLFREIHFFQSPQTFETEWPGFVTTEHDHG